MVVSFMFGWSDLVHLSNDITEAGLAVVVRRCTASGIQPLGCPADGVQLVLVDVQHRLRHAVPMAQVV